MYEYILRGVTVVGVRRGEFTLSEGPDGREIRLPVDDEDTERALAAIMADGAKGTLTVQYRENDEVPLDDSLRSENTNLRYQVCRLQEHIAALEKSRGVLSATVTVPNDHERTWCFTVPSGTERMEQTIAMMVVASLAAHHYEGTCRAFKEVAKLLGRTDTESGGWIGVMREMAGKADGGTTP